jgi:D-alanyl-D-alanine carboxypeptidase (penicillin-binding protein 5/6)
MVTSYPGLIGGKTGITDRAGYCLVEAAQRNGHTIITVVLKSTADAWYRDATTLLDYGFSVVGTGAPAASGLPKITLAPVLPAVQATTPVAAPASTDNLTVSQVSDQTAIVRQDTQKPRAFSWRWPVASLASMGIMLVVAMNYPAMLALVSIALRGTRPAFGGLQLAFATAGSPVLRFGTGGRRSRRHRPAHRRGRATARTSPAPARRAAPQTFSFASSGRVTPAHQASPSDGVIPLKSANTIAIRAIRMANRGDYTAAAAEFGRALREDRRFDLTRCSGFWGMQPAGYVAASKAYLDYDRVTDARSLLTVVKLSCGSNRELETLMNQVSSFVRS